MCLVCSNKQVKVFEFTVLKMTYLAAILAGGNLRNASPLEMFKYPYLVFHKQRNIILLYTHHIP